MLPATLWLLFWSAGCDFAESTLSHGWFSERRENHEIAKGRKRETHASWTSPVAGIVSAFLVRYRVLAPSASSRPAGSYAQWLSGVVTEREESFYPSSRAEARLRRAISSRPSLGGGSLLRCRNSSGCKGFCSAHRGTELPGKVDEMRHDFVGGGSASRWHCEASAGDGAEKRRPVLTRAAR
jgi:hypothetical protein